MEYMQKGKKNKDFLIFQQLISESILEKEQVHR